jgi:hypothetical protein
MGRLGAFATAAGLTVAGCASSGPEQVVVFDNLSQPRGLSVDRSRVCVAEAGAISAEGPAREEPGQLEADTGRVLCAPLGDGEPVAMIEGLPFVYYPDAAVTSGAADVVSDGQDLHVLVGESYGEFARSVVAVNASGTQKVVDLLAFAVARSSAGGGLRSNPYSFVIAPDRTGFFISDAATGTVLRAGSDGTVETFASVPGHEVLTGMTWGPDGALYVASFGQLPHPVGSGAVIAIDANGQHRVVVGDLTMVIDIGFDESGGIFILEYSSPVEDPQGTDAYRDGAGRLLYVSDPTQNSAAQVLLDRLDRPTGLSVGAEAVWISISAGEEAPGEGSVVRVSRSDLLAEQD